MASAVASTACEEKQGKATALGHSPRLRLGSGKHGGGGCDPGHRRFLTLIEIMH